MPAYSPFKLLKYNLQFQSNIGSILYNYNGLKRTNCWIRIDFYKDITYAIKCYLGVLQNFNAFWKFKTLHVCVFLPKHR